MSFGDTVVDSFETFGAEIASCVGDVARGEIAPPGVYFLRGEGLNCQDAITLLEEHGIDAWAPNHAGKRDWTVTVRRVDLDDALYILFDHGFPVTNREVSDRRWWRMWHKRAKPQRTAPPERPSAVSKIVAFLFVIAVLALSIAAGMD